MKKLVRYWGTDYDWRKVEARLNARPQFITEMDGVEIHFIHVRSKHENALLSYNQTALSALRDVSDALIWRERLGEVREQRTRQVTALGTSVKLSSERCAAGKASYYEVLEAQQQLFPSELNLARKQRDRLLALVSLYKALGGG